MLTQTEPQLIIKQLHSPGECYNAVHAPDKATTATKQADSLGNLSNRPSNVFQEAAIKDRSQR